MGILPNRLAASVPDWARLIPDLRMKKWAAFLRHPFFSRHRCGRGPVTVRYSDN